MSALPQPRLTPEQYLELDRQAEFRSEFIDGVMYAMSGGSIRHGRIGDNLAFALSGRLPAGCRPIRADVRLQVDPRGQYVYPDVMIACGRVSPTDEHADTINDPVVVFEVLSPSTERFDRGRKWELYRKLETLREYVLVSQNQPRIESFLRAEGGKWTFSEAAGLDSELVLASVNCAVPLAAIYRDVEFEAAQSEG